jgi:hypothetical protein
MDLLAFLPIPLLLSVMIESFFRPNYVRTFRSGVLGEWRVQNT